MDSQGKPIYRNIVILSRSADIKIKYKLKIGKEIISISNYNTYHPNLCFERIWSEIKNRDIRAHKTLLQILTRYVNTTGTLIFKSTLAQFACTK